MEKILVYPFSLENAAYIKYGKLIKGGVVSSVKIITEDQDALLHPGRKKDAKNYVEKKSGTKIIF